MDVNTPALEMTDALTQQVVDAAAEAAAQAGGKAGKERCVAALAAAFDASEIPYRARVWLPERYKGLRLDCGYVLDFVVDDRIIVQAAAGDDDPAIEAPHLLDYLRLSGCAVGLLVDFHATRAKDRVRRLCFGGALREAG